ncbi:MAG: hypothetical protein M3Z41_08515 [Candidatus Eremiobacteraeota bacterium]|nr:hypothetical protein [Candidatus Eremiobacteraeota bacterium]
MKASALGFAVAVVVAGLLVTPSSAAPPTLTGKMTKLNYLVGLWNCQTKVPAMQSMPAHTAKGTASFEVEPGNTVGFRITSERYSAAGYLGYLDVKQLWWTSGADNFGGVTFETGKSSSGNVYTINGSSMLGGSSVPTRDTITKASDMKYEDVYQLQKNGQWVLGADSVCTKQSRTPD